MFVIILLVAWFVQHSNEQHFSRFSATKIIQSHCVDESVLSTDQPNSLGCARACSKDRECRRLLYCSSDSSCKLYQDGTDCIMKGDSTSCTCFRKNIGCHGTKCTCPLGYYGDTCQYIIQGCRDGFYKHMGHNLTFRLALTYIQPSPTLEPFEMLCRLEYGGAWHFLGRKLDCSDESFNRSLAEYEEGFGKTRNNFWLGFNKIRHIMVNHGRFQIQIRLAAISGRQCYSNYDDFKISDKASGYTMTSQSVEHRGHLPFCGDSILGNMTLSGNPFSTYDVDHTGTYHCASRLGGGWWFGNSSDCARGFLTGAMNETYSDNFWLDDFNGETINETGIALWR